MVSVSFGSSPRGRGKLQERLKKRIDDGLIPARAGKTAAVFVLICVGPAHPRAGGENGSSLGSRFGPAGSSPRGRGKLRVTFRCHCGFGLIPARAGKTRCYPR